MSALNCAPAPSSPTRPQISARPPSRATVAAADEAMPSPTTTHSVGSSFWLASPSCHELGTR